MITALLALLNSPLAWFGLLVLSLTTAGYLAVLVARPQTPLTPILAPAPMSDREARYHSNNQIGR